MTVDGPGDAVVVLRIVGSATNKRSDKKGETKYSMAAIDDNGGKAMKNMSMDTLKNTGNPSPSTGVMQFKFPDSGKYPRAFALMCAPYNGGAKGAAKFNCSVFTKEKAAVVAKLN